MCRYGAESASAETASVDVDRVLDHIVGRDALALVAGMWKTGVGQVERVVELFGCHGWVGSINYYIAAIRCFLYDARGM